MDKKIVMLFSCLLYTSERLWSLIEQRKRLESVEEVRRHISVRIIRIFCIVSVAGVIIVVVFVVLEVVIVELIEW